MHRNGIKVVLTGEGADEIFGGYNIFSRRQGAAVLGTATGIEMAPGVAEPFVRLCEARSTGGGDVAGVFRGDLTAVDDRSIRTGSAGRILSGIRRFFAPDFASTMPTPDEILEDVSASIGGRTQVAPAGVCAVSGIEVVHVRLFALRTGRSHDDGALG